MLKKITLIVISLHLLGVCFLLFSPTKKSHLPPQKFAVQTKTFKNSQTIATRNTSNSKKPVPKKKSPEKKPVPKQSQPKEKAPPQKKKEQTPLPQPTKKTPPIKKVKEPPSSFEDNFTKELEKIVEKINKIQEKPQTSSSLQEIINQVQDEANFAVNSEEGYQQTLLTYLQEALHLPEQGEVKIQLTLKEDGNLAKIVVLKAESVKNKAYLEKQLPLLQFPNLQVLKVKEKTFVLTFCNEPKR